MEVTGQGVLSCVSFALGIGIASGVDGYVGGTISLFTAATAKQIARALCTRTLGWIGVAIVLYQFGKCLKNKQKGGYTIVVPTLSMDTIYD